MSAATGYLDTHTILVNARALGLAIEAAADDLFGDDVPTFV